MALTTKERIKRDIQHENFKRGVGIYEKYRVSRVDGSSQKGKKHYGCNYFVLDMIHDEFAYPALIAYGIACRYKYPKLSDDLLRCAMGGSSCLCGDRS